MTMHVSRRAFLRGGAAAATAGILGGAVQPVAAYRDSRPEHVSLRYDQAELERWRPALIDPVRPSSDEQAQQLYAWSASSPEHDLDAHVYFAKYRTQRGATSWDSHRRDREPVYVFVEPDLGEVREIAYTAYHWLASQEDAPPTMTRDGGEHPTLRIVAPHNHYVLSDEDEDDYELLDVAPLGTEDGHPFGSDGEQTTYEAWLDTNWRGALEPGVVQNPWRMQTRESWWKDGRETIFTRIWARSQLSMAALGIENPRVVGTAPESDLS